MVVLSFLLTGIVCSQGFAAFLLERKAAEKKLAFLMARFLLKSAFLEIRPSALLAVPPVLFDEKIYIRCIGGTSSTPGRWILSWMGSMAGKKEGRKNINKIRNQKFKIRNSYV